MKKKKIKSLSRGFYIFFIFLMWPVLGQSIENDECFDCHSDEALERTESEGMREGLFINPEKYNHSVHNINGITCVDCHADIEELNYDNELPHATALDPVCCDTCHEEEGEAYTNSVHKKAGAKGINMLCYGCHEHHYVQRLEAASVPERENEFCLKCHNANKFHDWLPQKETHFTYVECTVCHAPEVPRHIHLKFFDLLENNFIDGNEILKDLGVDHDGFMPLVDKNSDGIINVDEFDDLVFILRQKGVRSIFHAELVAELEPILHQVNRGEAKGKDCELCHTPKSPFFNDVNIVLPNPDRSAEHYKVERKVLETYHVRHFYALGGTRVRLLDKIGIALIAGGALVVAGHLTVRLLTAPARRRKEEEEDSEFD